ncbi:MAG TPA: PEP-CTERM sorting domain-containing protein [Steroidobacter sp.]
MRLFIALALLLALPAHATIITVDAGDYAPGTDVSHLLPGLTLTSFHQSSGNVPFSPTAQPVLIGELEGLPTFGGFHGDVRFAAGCYLNGFCSQPFSFLQLDFEFDTDYVRVTSVRQSVPAGLIAFDRAGNIVGVDFGVIDDDPARFSNEIRLDGSRIARVWYGGSLNDGVMATRISYSVPEPSTLILLSGSLLLLLTCRRLDCRPAALACVRRGPR